MSALTTGPAATAPLAAPANTVSVPFVVGPNDHKSYGAEASSLRWPPGKRPFRFTAVDANGALHEMQYVITIWNDGEVVGWEYIDEGASLSITVYND